MTPEEQRRQTELQDLRNKQNELNDLNSDLALMKEGYEDGLKRAKGSEIPWEKLSGNQKFDRLTSLSMTNAQFYEQEGLGASIKRNMEGVQQRIDSTWQDLQQDYGITPGNKEELKQAIAERGGGSPERNEPTLAERRAAKLAAQAQQQAQVEQQAPASQAVPSTQATPAPRQSGETKPTSQQQETQAPTHHERERRSRDMSGYQMAEDSGSYAVQQQGQQKVPLHDLYPHDTPSSPEPYLSQEERRAAWQDLLRHAGMLTDIKQGIEQIHADMDRDQQGQAGPWKTPLREQYEQEPDRPEPPRQERDYDR